MFNPYLAKTDEEIRLEMLIRMSLNKHWATRPNPVHQTLRYVERVRNIQQTHQLHQDKDTTDNLQIIEPTANIDKVKVI